MDKQEFREICLSNDIFVGDYLVCVRREYAYLEDEKRKEHESTWVCIFDGKQHGFARVTGRKEEGRRVISTSQRDWIDDFYDVDIIALYKLSNSHVFTGIADLYSYRDVLCMPRMNLDAFCVWRAPKVSLAELRYTNADGELRTAKYRKNQPVAVERNTKIIEFD